MSLLQVLLVAGVVLVVIALVAAWAGEVMGLNTRLDAADEEEEDWRRHGDYGDSFARRIDDQRRD